jgi:hypothetical protein
MGYCHDCGRFAALNDAAMCAGCRDAWRPSVPATADLGTRNPGAP